MDTLGDMDTLGQVSISPQLYEVTLFCFCRRTWFGRPNMQMTPILAIEAALNTQQQYVWRHNDLKLT